MPTYRARLPDGSSYRLEAPSELSNEQISKALQHHLNAPDVAPLFGEGLSKFAAPVAGAIGADLAFGAPLAEAGATIGTAIAPGIGTAIGGALGAGAASFLGATAGERIRQRLATAQTGQPLPSMGEAFKTAAPFGAFGLAGEGAAALSPFLRSGKVAATALKSGIGGAAAGTVAGLAHGERFPTALKEGVREAPLAAAFGGAFQALPNSLRYVTGNRAAISADRAATMSEMDRQVLAYRNGKLPAYLATRGHEIWQKVEHPIIGDATPITPFDLGKEVQFTSEVGGKSYIEKGRLLSFNENTGKAIIEHTEIPEYYSDVARKEVDKYGPDKIQLDSKDLSISGKPNSIPLKEFYDKAVSTYGKDSPQVATVLKAFGRSKFQMGLETSGAIPLPTAPFEEQQFASSGGMASPGGEELAKIFEQDRITPQQALDAASALGSKIKGGASAGFRRSYSLQDSLNADARATIYDVLKSRLSQESQQNVNAALQEYGEFATMRNIAHRTLQPFGNQKTPTASGRVFLQRLATGKASPDDVRLANFVQEATGQPQTPTGVEMTGNLPQLFENLASSQAYGGGGKYTGRAALRYGLLYPLFRAIRRGR